jgi:RNA polymerase sigma-70 factor (ECF subfamily)
MAVSREFSLALPGSPAAAEFSEAQLVALLRQRSSAAWAAFYDANYSYVYRYAVTRLDSIEQAEDVAATVFQRAFTAIEGYSYQGKPLLAWLYSISRNVVSEHYRGLQRRRALSLFRRPPAAADGSAGSSLLDAARASRHCEPEAAIGWLDLQRALAKLTDGQREVLILRHFVGLSARETANVLGKQERSVYSLHARAVESLRRLLR